MTGFLCNYFIYDYFIKNISFLKSLLIYLSFLSGNSCNTMKYIDLSHVRSVCHYLSFWGKTPKVPDRAVRRAPGKKSEFTYVDYNQYSQ